MSKWIKITGVIVLVGALFYLGFVVGQLSYEPKVVEVKVPEYITVKKIEYETQLVPYEIEKPVYITVATTKEVPVEVIKYRNICSRNFASVDSFKQWYEAQEFHAIMPNGGKADTADCDDYSERLQRKALEQGYPISQALAWYGKYFGKRVTEEKLGHAGNLVLIGNTYYWVEPQPDKFNMVKICDRD